MTSAQQQLVTDNVRLVGMVIKKYIGRPISVEMDDCFSNGYIGLCRAAMLFNPDYGCKFSTFAVPVIINAIRTPMRRAVAKSRDYRKTESLDAPMDDNGNTFTQCIEDVDDVDTIYGAREIVRYIRSFSDLEQNVLRLAYAGYKQVEIVKMLGISQPSVSRILARTYKRINEYRAAAI